MKEGYKVAKIANIWTNGNAIRKYVGQDRIEETVYPTSPNATQLHSMKDGWRKETAIILGEGELMEYTEGLKELKELKEDIKALTEEIKEKDKVIEGLKSKTKMSISQMLYGRVRK